MIEGRDIVIICGMHFHAEYWTSKQHIANLLAVENRVLFVERRPWIWEIRRWLSLLSGGVRREKGKLWLLPILYLIPGNYRWRFINALNQKLTILFLRRALRRLNIHQPIVWSFVHDANRVIESLGRLKIYHCVDNWQEFPRWEKGLALRLEKMTAKGSDIVFASAMVLAERLKKLNPETHYFPNAVDLDTFRSRSSDRIPEDLARIPGPRICYMGSLEMWFDVSLVRDLARRRPEWSFILFGALGKTFTGHSLFSVPNVHYLGLKRKETLRDYLLACDVCIIPFKINNLTRSVSPLKLFEYFACGKPIVSTELPEVSRFIPLVRIARTPFAFEKAISESLNEGGKLFKRRIAAAWENSWARRIEEYSRVINSIEKGNRQR